MHIKCIMMMLFALWCFVASASADTIISDIDNTDLTRYSSYWTGDDTNPIDLNNNGEGAEENWLEALLGLEYDDPTVNLILKQEDGLPVGETTFVDYDPDLSWDYAIIKAATISYAYEDTLSDDLLSWTGSSPSLRGVSHISFFSRTEQPEPVPEPATMLLFAVGLAGLAAVRLRKSKNV